jgi:chromosome segregation ATPase
MAFKFANILKAMKLGSDKEAITEAHLQSADDTIAQLEQAKTEADTKLATAEANLKTAQDEKAKTAQDLKAAEEKAATLQEWKDNQATVDGRDEDDSNSLDGKQEASEPWEKMAASAIDIAKKRVGKK